MSDDFTAKMKASVCLVRSPAISAEAMRCVDYTMFVLKIKNLISVFASADTLLSRFRDISPANYLS